MMGLSTDYAPSTGRIPGNFVKACISVLAHLLQSTGSMAGNKESSHADIRVSVGE